MAFARQLRQEIESTLRGRAVLQLAPRLVCPGLQTGYDSLDAVLQQGLPVAGTTELIGERTSGRATVAAAYVAERTREGHVCAWVDVGGELDGAACAANGADLSRLLVVRCLGELERTQQESRQVIVSTEGPRTSWRRDRSIGTPGVQNRMFLQADKRVEQTATDRMPARRGVIVLERREEMRRITPEVQPAERTARPKKPWGRLEQAIKAVDLLIQAGGFQTVVFDLGSVLPQVAQRIPLATWFRWRAGLERTRTSLVVLSQMGCAGSSAELVLRVHAEMPQRGTVLAGGSYRLQVARRRFEQQPSAGQRRGPQSAGATAWESRVTWSA